MTKSGALDLFTSAGSTVPSAARPVDDNVTCKIAARCHYHLPVLDASWCGLLALLLKNVASPLQ